MRRQPPVGLQLITLKQTHRCIGIANVKRQKVFVHALSLPFDGSFSHYLLEPVDLAGTWIIHRSKL